MNTAATAQPDLRPLQSLVLPPNGSELATKAQRALAFIESMPVTNPDEYALAAEELQGVKSKWGALEKQRTALTVPLNDVLRGINALFKGPQDMLKRAEDLLKGKLIGYDNEQRKIAAEQQRQAEEAARIQREAQEAEAERLRVAAAAAAAAAATAQAAGDTAKAEASLAEAQRTQAEAHVAETAAQMVVAPTVAPATVKVKGISTADGVDFEVVSLHELAAHVVATPELINLLEANDKAIRQYVKGLGMQCKLPGVRVFPKQTMRAGA